ncbi:hypothetical protein N798_01615 [Knoellia flava TL1]|uniref:Exo-alpha-sialidase n=1 Tax=Knoellia flava TL1 TaxID=1385518 RepID=A0ABR4XJC5_9MICO|nr:hypothetical protein N798_01615 [Knoellia flava TL1]
MDRVAGWLDGSNPRATRRFGWAAVAAVALALAWPFSASDGVAPHAAGPASDVGTAPTAVVPRAPECWPESGRASTRPPGLAAVSTSPVDPNDVVESTRWGRLGSRGLWGVAAVAECNVVRLDAVWFEPGGRKQRHRIDGSGPAATGVVADGLDGAIAIYSVGVDGTGRLAARLHISTDWGRTWQQREVPASAEPDVRAGQLPAQWERWRVLDG